MITPQKPPLGDMAIAPDGHLLVTRFPELFSRGQLVVICDPDMGFLDGQEGLIVNIADYEGQPLYLVQIEEQSYELLGSQIKRI